MTDTTKKIHILFATLIANIEPHEMNRTTQKVRKQYRLWLNKILKDDKDLYHRLQKETQEHWESMNKKLGDHNELISLPVTLLELIDMLPDDKRDLVSSKALMERMIESQSDYERRTHDVEVGAVKVGAILREEFGIKARPKLGFIKQAMKRKEFDEILSKG